MHKTINETNIETFDSRVKNHANHIGCNDRILTIIDIRNMSYNGTHRTLTKREYKSYKHITKNNIPSEYTYEKLELKMSLMIHILYSLTLFYLRIGIGIH